MKKRMFLWIGIVLTLAVGVIALAFAASQASRDQAAKLEELRKEAKSLGLPTTLDEVQEGMPSDDVNAAVLIVQASGKLDSDPEAAANLMFEASKRTACVFKWSEAKKDGFLERLRFQDCVAAQLDQVERLSTGTDFAEFKRRLHAANVVSRLVAMTPSEEAFRESCMAQRQVYDRVGKLMLAAPGNENVMQLSQAEAFDQRSLMFVLLAVRRFVAMGNEVAQNREVDGDQKVTWIWSRGDFPTDPWGRDAVEARHLQGAMDLYKDLEGAKSWPEVMRILETTTDKWKSDARPASYTLRLLGTSIRDLGRVASENEAARRLLFVSASAFRSHRANRAFPARSPVIGETNLDPFTNTPLKYATLGTGFYIYSVGPDLTDEGGTTTEGLTFATDIGFVCKTVEQTSANEQSTPR